MTPREKKLLQLFGQLSEADQGALISYADFLCSRVDIVNTSIAEPVYIEAKAGETVIGAIKRLSSIYSMLDRAKMLNETSVLVSQHVLQGRAKEEVIQELEAIFQSHYQRLKEEKNQ